MSSASSSTASATGPRPAKLRVFSDADVLISGSLPRSRQSASSILLEISELTLIEGVYSPYVVEQAERNIRGRLPQALPKFRDVLASALMEVPDASAREFGAVRRAGPPSRCSCFGCSGVE